MVDIKIRNMQPDDRYEIAELIYCSLNTWYETHGIGRLLAGGPRTACVFYDVYSSLEPSRGIVAVEQESGVLAGSCFFHPRETHVSLGIMNVHPNYFGFGVGKALLKEIINFTENNGYPSLRLTQSALNLDSFSLYNAAGFVPRFGLQDMMLQVPSEGLKAKVPDQKHVREAKLEDVAGMAALERSVSGITREEDYRYCIENELGFWHVSVYENEQGGIEGFAISSGHDAMNMIGPLVARSAREAEALLLTELDRYRGRTPIFLLPMKESDLVQRMYKLGARNCELHLCQVRGEFQELNGISTPTFLLETG